MTLLLHIIMWRLVYFFFALYVTGVYTAGDIQECLELMTSEAQKSTCCKVEPIKKERLDMDSKEMNEKFADEYEECKDLPDDGKHCSEKGICLAKKSGLMKENGDIDKEAIKNMMQDKMEPMMLPEVYQKMEACVDKDLSKFESDSTCYFQTLGNCMEVHYVMGCVEWSDEKSCAEMKNTVDECAKNILE